MISCASYRSLYLLSASYTLRLCGILLFNWTLICQISIPVIYKYVIQHYNSIKVSSALLLSTDLKVSISQGMNITYLLNTYLSKMRLKSNNQHVTCSSFSLVIKGRVKSKTTNRWIARTNSLCVGSYTCRILDVGYHVHISNLGTIGIKLALTSWSTSKG